MRCTRLIEKKLNTNIFLAEQARGGVGIWNVKCLLLTMSMRRGPNYLYVSGILRRKTKIDFST